MSLTDDHFARKIAAQSKAWEETNDAPKKERKREPAEPKMGICDKCKKEALLRPYRFKETSVSNGAASFGTVTKHLCEDCAPKSRAQKDAEVPQLDKKQLKWIGLNRMTFYVNAQNVFTLTKYTGVEPNNAGTPAIDTNPTPSPHQYTLGINIEF
jgi:RNase P subunit RPR2